MKKHLFCQISAVVMASVLTVTSIYVPVLSGKPVTAKAAVTETVLKSWDFNTGTDNWGYGGKYQYTGEDPAITAEEGMLKVPVDYSKDSESTWSQVGVNTWDNAGMNLKGANKVTLDFIYDPSKLTKGSFNVKLYSNSQIDSFAPVSFDNSVKLTDSLNKVTVTIKFNDVSGDSVNDFFIGIVGSQTDYKGDLYLDNIHIIKAVQSETVKNELKAWTFDTDTQNWYYGSGWEYQYKGAPSSAVSADNGKLKVDVDYSADSDSDYSKMAVCCYNADGMNLTGANKVYFDFYYDTSMMTTGSFLAGAYSNSGIDASSAIDFKNAETVEGTIKKVPVVISFDPPAQSPSSVKDFAICLIGSKTDYKGSLWLDNIRIMEESSSAGDIYVNSTVPVKASKPVAIADGNLVTPDTSVPMLSAVTLVDKDAAACVKQAYAYLEAMGKSQSVIFGQQNNTHHKAGSADLSCSDTYDVTGSYAGIIGIDALSLTGNEYSASRYNKELGKTAQAAPLPETAAGNVMAAAALTNYSIDNGAIITLSAHMPNFSLVQESGNYDGVHSYSNYNFTGYSPNILTGNVMNQILPGGQYNTVYNAYLDMIADYASQVNGSLLFRPFHENTGSWFWWGAAFCDAATYKNVYRYTVEYLRDTKNIHNLIYVYGPGSEAANTAEYGERYPGDDYVDMVGFDMYNSDPAGDNTWLTSFQNELNVVQDFAAEHNKLLAVTETGVASSTPDKGDNQTALHKTGNKELDWYEKLLNAVKPSNASYFLVWANFGEKDGFYTPYVKSVNPDNTLHGHEMLDNFIDFYNDDSSIFAADQKTALEELKAITVTASPTTTKATGYITSPVSGTRILTATPLSARVKGCPPGDSLAFLLHGETDKTIPATVSGDGITYTATIDDNTLAALGKKAGSIELMVNGTSLDTIGATFNIPEPAEDPYLIDGFENYYGVDSLLTKKWAANKASGSTISISLTKEKDKVYSGDYAMKFTYNETADGWAGATISKEVDWSKCNALQFFTIPDGNNQKVVIQITANNTVYEVHLNLYDGYTGKTSPMLVTIPFSEFFKRDAAGNPKGGLTGDCSSVTSFGLWVNALADTPAAANGKVTGTIYYDGITAVTTGSTGITFNTDLSGGSSNGSNNNNNNGNNSGNNPGNSSNNNTSNNPGNSDSTNATDSSTGSGSKPSDIVISTLKTAVSTDKNSSNKKFNALLAPLIKDSDKQQYVMVQVSGTVSAKNNTLKIYAASLDGIKPGSTVYLYAYNKASNKLEYLNKTAYTVDKDGYITAKIPDARNYVILEQVVDGKDVLSRAEQTAVKETLAVKNGSQVSLNIKIREEFKTKAVISYEASNPTIASVNKGGLITAKKKGKATITTTVRIGKVTKKFKTIVTVK